jgi:hypothetical protein
LSVFCSGAAVPCGPFAVGAVGQRRGDAVGVPGLPAAEAPAEVLVGHPVHVALDDPADAAVLRVALRRRPGGLQVGLGELRAALRRRERHGRDRPAGRLRDEPDLLAAGVLDGEVARGLGSLAGPSVPSGRAATNVASVRKSR